jgi:hypothetical protein
MWIYIVMIRRISGHPKTIKSLNEKKKTYELLGLFDKDLYRTE